jgi:hypothetical protein
MSFCRVRYMAIPDFTPSQALPGDELFYPPSKDGSDYYKARFNASLVICFVSSPNTNSGPTTFSG